MLVAELAPTVAIVGQPYPKYVTYSKVLYPHNGPKVDNVNTEMWSNISKVT